MPSGSIPAETRVWTMAAVTWATCGTSAPKAITTRSPGVVHFASGGYSSGVSSAALTAAAGSAKGVPLGTPHGSSGPAGSSCRLTDESAP